MLPTNIGRLFVAKFRESVIDDQWEAAIVDFQKAALTEDFDTTMRLFGHWLLAKPTEEQMVLFNNLYELTRIETKGNLVQMVAEVFKENSSGSVKLEAIKLLDALLDGSAKLGEGEAARLIIKLANTDED